MRSKPHTKPPSKFNFAETCLTRTLALEYDVRRQLKKIATAKKKSPCIYEQFLLGITHYEGE